MLVAQSHAVHIANEAPRFQLLWLSVVVKRVIHVLVNGAMQKKKH